jgi:hypothetical protein
MQTSMVGRHSPGGRHDRGETGTRPTPVTGRADVLPAPEQTRGPHSQAETVSHRDIMILQALSAMRR